MEECPPPSSAPLVPRGPARPLARAGNGSPVGWGQDGCTQALIPRSEIKRPSGESQAHVNHPSKRSSKWPVNSEIPTDTQPPLSFLLACGCVPRSPWEPTLRALTGLSVEASSAQALDGGPCVTDTHTRSMKGCKVPEPRFQTCGHFPAVRCQTG